MKVFKESQRFDQLWMHLLLGFSFLVPVALVVREWIVKGDDEGKTGLLLVLGSMVLVYGFIFMLRLKTRIDEKGIYYRFIPFHFSNRFIKWTEIEKAYVRNYSPISEYGGWGMKGGKLWDKSKGIAYNVKGDIGLQLELKNGEKILIGTQRKNDIERVMSTYIHKIFNDEI